jgi:hypothetical protein
VWESSLVPGLVPLNNREGGLVIEANSRLPGEMLDPSIGSIPWTALSITIGAAAGALLDP